MTLTIYNELEQGSDERLDARDALSTSSELNLIVPPQLPTADNEKTRAQ